MLVFCDIPKGHPPVELEALGTVRAFHPQDQIWKKVLVQNDVMILRDPYDRTKERMKDGKPVFAKNLVKRWVIDTEETEKLKAKKRLPPSRQHELSNDEWQMLAQGKMENVRKFFKPAAKLEAEQRDAFAIMQREHDQRIKEAEEALKVKLRAIDEQNALLDAQLVEATKASEKLSAGESKATKR